MNNELFYDVVVVGGGTAGIAAALSAAKHQCSVLVIERSYSIGGSSTIGQVTPRMNLRVDGFHTNTAKMIYEKLRKRKGTLENDIDGKTFHPELLKCALEELMHENGITLLYGATIFDVNKAENNINSIAVHAGNVQNPSIGWCYNQ